VEKRGTTESNSSKKRPVASRPIVQIGFRRDRLYPDVPLMHELEASDEQGKVLAPKLPSGFGFRKKEITMSRIMMLIYSWTLFLKLFPRKKSRLMWR